VSSGPAEGTVHRSGLVSFVGRPNTGKSTLMNALVGQKVAITSSRPQTTRHTIRGVVGRPQGQLVIVDTPGVHRPRTALGQRLNDLVMTTLSQVDAVGFCVPADEATGPGDRFIAERLRDSVRGPVVAIVTKADRVGRDALAARLAAVAEFSGQAGLPWAQIVPVSASSGENLEVLASVLIGLLPPGPPLYPDGETTDEPELVLVAELIREAILEEVDDELPHSIAVVVDEMIPREDRPADRPLTDVYASLFVERDSQKPIVLGRGGERLARVGARSRRQIQRVLGTPVHLDLRVKVAKEWQRDAKQMRRLGF
jgi:GTP-binding protein Era